MESNVENLTWCLPKLRNLSMACFRSPTADLRVERAFTVLPRLFPNLESAAYVTSEQNVSIGDFRVRFRRMKITFSLGPGSQRPVIEWTYPERV